MPADRTLWPQAINQHPYEDRGVLKNDYVAALAHVVSATERTLFCLDMECVSLTRIWCMFEVRAELHQCIVPPLLQHL